VRLWYNSVVEVRTVAVSCDVDRADSGVDETVIAVALRAARHRVAVEVDRTRLTVQRTRFTPHTHIQTDVDAKCDKLSAHDARAVQRTR